MDNIIVLASVEFRCGGQCRICLAEFCSESLRISNNIEFSICNTVFSSEGLALSTDNTNFSIGNAEFSRGKVRLSIVAELCSGNVKG